MIQLVFVCSTRDFHAIDWYKSAKKICKLKPLILTDSKSSEGFKNLVNDKNNVFDLFIIDKFLFKKMSVLGNIWRNIIKLIFLPFQIYILKKFSKRNPGYIYYAHSMYYMWLCHFAKVKFIGTPQGSEILIRTYKSTIYKLFSAISIQSSIFTTCDSKKMARRIYEISKKHPYIIQNGVDTNYIEKINNQNRNKLMRKNEIVSFRGLSSLYRTKDIFKAREYFKETSEIPIRLIYPFYENSYRKKIFPLLKNFDNDIGKISKNKLLKEFTKYLLYISIPASDSSPRSVYECVLSGGIVAITREEYYEDLPKRMKDRIIVIDLKDKDWLLKSIEKAKSLNSKKFDITKINLNRFDQQYSFNIIYEKLILILKKQKFI